MKLHIGLTSLRMGCICMTSQTLSAGRGSLLLIIARLLVAYIDNHQSAFYMRMYEVRFRAA